MKVYEEVELGNSCTGVVSFPPLPLYPWGKSPQCPLDRRLGGSQSRSGRRGEHFLPYRDSNSDSSIAQPVSSRYTDCTIPARET
jgi:hypothetical protein